MTQSKFKLISVFLLAGFLMLLSSCEQDDIIRYQATGGLSMDIVNGTALINWPSQFSAHITITAFEGEEGGEGFDPIETDVTIKRDPQDSTRWAAAELVEVPVEAYINVSVSAVIGGETWTGSTTLFLEEGMTTTAEIVLAPPANPNNNPPNVPSNPYPYHNQIMLDTVSVNLFWSGGDPDGDYVTYFVEWGTNDSMDNHAEGLVDTSYTFNVEKGAHYYWQVTSEDIFGEISTGPIWEFYISVGASNQPPTTPYNPSPADSASNVEADSVVLSWSADDPEGFPLQYSLNWGTSISMSNHADSLISPNFTLTNLVNNTIYYWQAYAMDEMYGIYGPIWSFTTKLDTGSNNPPSVPINPFPPDSATGIDTASVTFSWSCDDLDGDTLSYTLRWGTSSSIDSVETAITDTNFTLENLHAGSHYYWQVTACDQSDSCFSEVWEFFTIGGPGNNPPYEPTNPNPANGATGIDTANVTLTWSGGDPDNNLSYYRIYWDTQTPISANTDTTYDSAFIITNLNPGTVYYWKIVAVDSEGDSTAGAEWNFETVPVVQIITFPDPNLEQAVRDHIGVPSGPIYVSMVDTITVFDANSSGISNLTGMEYMTSMVTLYISNNEITALMPLANMSQLEFLQIGFNNISSINPLANLNELEIILLNNNNISDITPLSEPNSLNYIGLTVNLVSDLEPLVINPALSSGDSVYITGNNLNDYSYYIYIPELESRGVGIVYDPPPPNNPPNTPSDPNPLNGATGIDTSSVTLSWTGGDPDNHPMHYRVYWDTNSPPTANSDTTHDTTYVLIDLDPGMTYYWKIVAVDLPGDSTGGPEWQFTSSGLYTIIGTCVTDNAFGVALSGNYAYVADGSSGLQIIDISSPSNPTHAGSYDTPGYAYGVVVSGNYAYMADGSSGLQIIDVSNPSNPTLAGSYDTPDYAQQVAVSGDYAYVTGGDWGLLIIDISSPSNPTFTGSFVTPDVTQGVAVSGDYAYVADAYSGLQIIDVSSPSNPTFAGSCDTPDIACGVAVSWDCAYVADLDSGLQIIDVSSPSNPNLAGSCDTPGGAGDVAISENYAYVADSDYGLQIIDISSPSNPTLVGFCDTPNWACDVAVSGNYAYVADSDSGLQIIRIQ